MNDVGFRKFLGNVYAYIVAGLLVCASVAYASVKLDILPYILTIAHPWSFFILLLLPYVIYFYLHSRVFSLSIVAAEVWFFLYTAITGLAISPIIYIYTAPSIIYAIAATAVLFIVMTLIAKYTNVDFLKYRMYFLIASISIVILFIVNAFLGNTVLTLGLQMAILLLSLLSVYYSHQLLTNIYDLLPVEHRDKAAVLGALWFFVELMDIFIMILQLFGSRRND